MTREKLIELRWLLKQWIDEQPIEVKNELNIEYKAEVLIAKIDTEIERKEN